MSWNYRVVKNESGWFAIYEVYYDDSGKVYAMSADAVSPEAEDLTALKARFELMQEALDDEILELQQLFPNEEFPLNTRRLIP